MRMLNFIVVLLLLNPMSGIAGKIVKAKYAGEFMSTGVGARALGMGGTFVAISEDVTAGYWNPAALATLEYPQVAGMYAERFASIVNYNYGAISIPIRPTSGISLSLIRLAVDDIPNTTNALLDYGLDGIPNTGDPGEGNGKIDPSEAIDPKQVFYFNSAEYALYLSYGSQHSEKFFYGGNVKVLRKGIGENSAWGMGFDITGLWRPLTNLNVGFNLQDITTTLLVWDTGRQEAITPTAKLGMAYFWKSNAIAGQIIPAIDMDVRFENRRFAAQSHLGPASFDFHLGAEYRFKQLLAMRVGWDTGHFATGIGIKLPRLNVDYAFLSHQQLGDTHRISVILTLEEQKFKRK